MNNQGQPPQQGQPNPMAGQQAAGGHPAGAPRPANMYRPEMMRNLPILNDEEKTKYERGLRSLWNSMESHPEDAPAHLEAKKKIQDFTKMLMGKLQARRLQMQQHQQQQKEAQAQAQSQAQGQVQIQTPAQQPTPQVQPPSQPTPLQSAAPVVPAQLPQTAGVPATQDPSGGALSQPTSQPSNNAAPSAPADTMPPATAAPAQSAPGQAAAQPQHSIPDHIMQHVRLMTFNAPAQIVAEKGQEAAAKWSSDMKSRYLKSLMQMEHSGLQIRKINALVKDRQEKGVPLSAEDLKQMQVRREHNQKVYADAQRFVEQFRKSQEISKGNAAAGGAARPAQQGNASAPAAGASQPGAQASPPPVVGQPVQVPQPMVAAQAQAQAQAQLQPAQSLSNGPGVVGAAGTVPQQPPAQARQQPPVQQQPLPTAAPGTVPTTNANPATQTLQQQQPLPQQVSTATATQPQMASASTPTQPAPRVQTPQSALPGGSQVLSHSAAVSRANQRVNSQVGGIAPQPGTGTPTPGSAPTQGAAASTTMGGVQQSQPPPATPTPQTSHTLQSKLPIPKNLPERAQGPPQPVSMAGGAGAGRPTYSGGTGIAGGVMGQPAMQRIPVFSQEAEGDHVLSKKKLDELVRQVCGGTAEGQEGNLLSPEVEENVLGLADSFVDNVLNAACRNAKERGSKVLEIRDIQLVLERTYNIRVPGYSSDDLRTVRKVQPAPAWITKMSAIQAAKVTSGKTE